MSWIKLYRKIMDDPAYLSEPFTRTQAWIDLLLLANYTPGTIYVRGIKVDVGRGQLAVSHEWLAKRWRWSRGRVTRYLDVIESNQQIVQQKSRIISLISIVNYDNYQSDGTTNGTTDGTTNGTTDGTHTKEIKKNKNIKETSLTRGKEKTAATATVSSASCEAEAYKTKEAKRETMPYKEIKDAWNEICTGYPRIVTLSDGRKNKMRNRVAEMGGAGKALPILREVFARMQASSFLRGDNRRGWKASFDWVFENDKNWVKVYEQNYDNRPDAQTRYRNNNKNCNDEWQ